MNALKRGAFIVIEGVDRSGKSTQCRKLVETLKSMNIPSELLVFPDRTTKIGQLINDYISNKSCELNDHVIHLLFSANRWEKVEKINKCLSEGITLIVDRYSYSGIAFSAAKDGMDFKWCKEQEVGLPKPDLVFLLTVSKDIMMKRPGFGVERYENPIMQAKVATNYQKLIDENWSIVEAGRSIEEVHDDLLQQILQTIKTASIKPIDLLKFKDTAELNEKENNVNAINENKPVKSS